MSYFLFGSCNASYEKELLQQVKLYAEENDLYVWFNDEITFYNDIQIMLEEQKSEGNIKFAITSKNQPRNSSDVLFPFDKFENEVLFADESRRVYKKCCKENIDILIQMMRKLFFVFRVERVELFVVEGYDEIFQRKMCNIEELKKDLLCQIEEQMTIESCIYCVNL